MDNYFCIICNKNYKSYHSLWIHKNKFHKTDDKKISVYKCKYCNKEFDKRHNKFYHQKNCNLNFDNKNNNNNDNKNNNNNNNDNNKNTNIINTNIINTNIINNNNNITNITINNYNNDNIDYISEKFKEKLFEYLSLKNYSFPLPLLIENIKFNSNHKENNNVKITNIRSKIGFYYDHNKWIAINKNQLLEELCDYSYKIFLNFFNQKKDTFNKEIKDSFEIFTAKIKSSLKDGIKNKIEHIAYIFTLNK
jgi:hypothetical protein